jgi:hypothetical protein
MDLPSALNSPARKVATTLSNAFPERQFAIEAIEGGHLEASLSAPAGALSGSLIVLTAGEGDIWVRFAPPHAFYSVADEQELVRVVRALLTDDALFALTYQGDEWTETTPISPGQLPSMGRGQRAVVLSRSGEQDANLP